MDIDWNSPETVLHLKLRDPEFCEQLYTDWRDHIRHTGRSCGLSEDLLDDLVQEVLMNLIGCGECRFDPDRGTFYTFLKHVTRLRSIDLLRRLYRRMKTADAIRAVARLESEAFVPDWVAAPRDDETVLKKLLDLLQKGSSSLHYQIFFRIVLREEKSAEIAREYHMPLPTIYSIVGRMTLKLRKLASSIELP